MATTIGGSIGNALGSLWGGNSTTTQATTATQAMQQGLGAFQPGTCVPWGVSGTTTNNYPMYQAQYAPTPAAFVAGEELDKLKKDLLDEIDIKFNNMKTEIIEAISQMMVSVPTDEIRKALGDAQ